MKNNYLISGIPIMDNNAQGKGFLDISLEDVKMSEDASDIIAGKVAAQAIGYTDGEEFNPIVYEGSDVSLTGAGGGGGDTATITVNYFLEGDPLSNIAAAGINWWYYGEDDPNHHWGSVGVQVNETPYTFTIPIISGSTLVGPFCTQTNDNFYIPFNNISITGDAVWNADESKYIISGDATINCEMIMD